MDIKPDNICFSPSLKQFIFIDYGLTTAIKEEIGFKSMTYFAGSFSFCSPEMLLLFNNPSGWIDLYFNDMHSLKETF